jgi:hypothetical protein
MLLIRVIKAEADTIREQINNYALKAELEELCEQIQWLLGELRAVQARYVIFFFNLCIN